MNWTSAIALARVQSASRNGRDALPDGGELPRVKRGDAAAVTLAAAQLADRSGVEWPWLPAALAVLDYRAKGDRFPEATDTAAAVTLPSDAAYFWWSSLEQLAAGLDGRGVPVRQIATEGGREALLRLEMRAWEELRAARRAGAEPSWVVPLPGRPPVDVPLPDAPKPQPPFTGPPTPDWSALLLLGVGLYILTRD